MHDFTAYRLVVEGEVIASIALNEHKGSALRGAIYHALRRRFCTVPQAQGACVRCPLWQACPVCTLVSTLDSNNRLGADAARPYTVQPPLDGDRLAYAPGERLTFGLTLYAEAMHLFPYVVMALYGLEEEGLGRRVEANGWRRGALRIAAIHAENPLTGDRVAVVRPGETLVQVPDLGITHAQVLARAAALQAVSELTLTLQTPTRLIHRQVLVKPGELTLAVLLARLFDRLESLAQHFSDTPLRLPYRQLLEQAGRATTVRDDTRWVELRSYSTRQRRATPIGGLMGRITLACDDWRPFLPWLLWGQFTHVGKDAVKGNGWYVIT
ncbi:MAG TPA: CRISPR system precrRNA processing endoribonuclease RAMP protein Cas6 [Chloroflexi bacterium]|nr:CRISPR system precrRNA processing endoribonuclease RAMP protein Cas6 [Chloroflexota bacterium]